MTCEKARRLLALRSGGDLPGGREAQVSAHLAGCEPCRSLALDLGRSAAWTKEAVPPPLTDTAYAEMRREVWRRIESGQARPKAGMIGRLAWAAAGIFAAALAAFLLVPRPRQGSAVVARRPPAIRPRATPATQPAVSPIPEAPAAASAAASATSPEPFRVAAVSRPRRPARQRSSAAAGDSPVERIEFRTANPNVRIIWLVRKGEEKSSSNAAGRIEEVS